MAKNYLQLPLKKHFKSRFPVLNRPRLGEIYCTDTFFFSSPSVGGINCAQVFVGKSSNFGQIYGMKSESQGSETLEDFKQTEKLAKQIKYINSYSFIFSARPGTPAFNLKKINQSEAKKRLISFQSVAEEIKTNYRETLIDKISNVLFENKTKQGNKYFGRDEYLNSVIVKSNESLVGKIKKVKITSGNHNTLYGEILSNLSQKNYAA